MAIVQNPITGRSSGTFGGAVFATQFGKNVLRSKPVSVSVSQSDASKLARQKFKAIAEAVNELLPALSVFFTSKQFNMPISSYIIKQCYDKAISGTLDSVTIDYTKIIPAPDSLGLADHLEVDVATSEVALTIAQPAIKNIVGADNKLDIAVYNVTTGKLVAVVQDQAPDSPAIIFESSLVALEDIVHVFVKPKKKVPFTPGNDLCVRSSYNVV